MELDRLVAVVVLDSAADAAPLASALVDGGLRSIEVTFRTAAAEEALRIVAEHPGVVPGAGTVVTPEQVDRAVAAGARFVVSPGFSAAVVARCQEAGVPVFPGVATPTEVIQALDAGVDVVKFFPAEALGGLATLKAIAAPFPGVRFVPTGGISAANMAGYLAHPQVAAVGGSWMVQPKDLAATTRLAAEAVALT